MNKYFLFSSLTLLLSITGGVNAQQGTAKNLLAELHNELREAKVNKPFELAKAEPSKSAKRLGMPEVHMASSVNNSPWRWRSSRKKPNLQATPVVQSQQAVPVPASEEPLLVSLNMPLDSAAIKDAEFHTVQPGEDILSIASFYGMTPSRLRSINKMRGIRPVIAGQILRIKDGSAPAPDTSNAPKTERIIPRLPMGMDGLEVYTVKSGDNPSTIAKRHNVGYKDLMEVNEITNPKLLKIGQKLRIPRKKLKTEPVFDPQGFDVYVVKVGDSPWTIARGLGVEYHALIGLNGIVDPTSLKVGQKLKVPRKN